MQQRPRRALAALSYAARRGEFPQKFWQTLVSHWPANVPQRLRWTLAYRLVRLPTPIVSALRYYISDWFRQNLPALAQASSPRALDLWDQMFQHFVAGGADATISSLGDTFIRGVPQHRSRRTHGHALNSPIGRLADVLLGILRRSNVSARAGIPAEIKSRLERAMTAPGEGRDHAISELAVQLTWLHHLDPVWVREQFIPLFDPTHHDSEPAWNGYAYDNNNAGPELFALLKPYFLEVFRFTPQWHWDDGVERHFTKQLVQYCWWHLNDARYITYSEARKALQGTDDQGRAHAAWFLGRMVKDHQCWQLFGKPFLQLAWPRERRCQTPAVSSQLVSVALASGDDFPDAVQTLLLLLVPVEQLDVLLHEMVEDPGRNESRLAEKFPEALLALLDSTVPHGVLVSAYGLSSLLTSIATSAPQLRQDPRWRRLDSIAHRQ